VPPLRNVFACLVHESQPCVVDLVRNLRYLDPSSAVLLYDGGRDPGLLGGFPFARLGAVLHPRPRPMAWGRLHDFAVDCMRFALEHLPFDTLTIVDSDQLAVGRGYSSYLGRFLEGRPRVGMLGNPGGRQPPGTGILPAACALEEADLWRPFLRRFPGGEEEWVHWTFWPSTVFTAAAARNLTRLFDTDAQLQDLLDRTRTWATEEVLLPTLVALLGHDIAANPCSYDYVRVNTRYPLEFVDGAISRPDVFWIHPVPRRYDDPARQRIRASFNQYRKEGPALNPPADRAAPEEPVLLLTLPLLARMKDVEGWLAEDEADLLAAATARALRELPRPHAVVEVGSYCGRSTVVLGGVVQALDRQARVYAIDPHTGVVGARDQGLHRGPPTFDRFRRTLDEAGLSGVVEPIRAASYEVPWDRPVGLLLIDALHDYPSVATDFYHFESHLLPGGYAAFHDYADYYPGVRAFVDELLGSGRYRQVGLAGSLMVVQKLAPTAAAAVPAAPARPEPSPDTVWLYWEGPMPPYVALCCKTVLVHNRNVVLLDRAGFEALLREDRDLDLDTLAVNHRSDFIRAYLLRHYGGLYLDADCIVLRDLAPVLDEARRVGFAGYREPSGYVSCNLMAAVKGGEVITEHYRELCRRVRGGQPLQWLDLASVPMEAVIARLPGEASLLPTEAVMPLPWADSRHLCVRRGDAEHDRHVRTDAYCYMLSNNTIKSRPETRLLYYMTEEELLGSRCFISHLFRRALGLPGLPGGPAPSPGGHEGRTQFDEGAFDYLAARFAVRTMVDVGCGPGGMVYYARSRGVRAVGVDGDPEVARGCPAVVEHDYTRGPLFLGEFDLGWSTAFVEHVEERYLGNYLETFRGCKAVFVTAAGPGSSGPRSVNCRPRDYWVARFAEAGFRLDEEATAGVRGHSTMASDFTRDTGLVFVRAAAG
jgi:hypothetical protein